MSEMDVPQLALCGDHRMAIPMTVTIRSLVRRSRSRLDFHLIAEGFSQDQRRAIQQAVNATRGDTVRFLQLDRRFDELSAGVGNSRAYYFRLALPSLLPGLSHILYLDSDLLVRGDVQVLWNEVRRANSPLQACIDETPTITARLLPVYREYGLEETDPYYNSGVLGMNLDLCRSEQVSERIVAFLRKHGNTCPLWDQAAINALFSKSIVPLPEEWNVFSSRAHPAAKIIHYCAFKKPFALPQRITRKRSWQLAAWQKAMEKTPFFIEYFSCLDETAYCGWRPRSFLTRLFSLVPMALLQNWRARRLRRGAAAPPVAQVQR